MTTIDDKSHAYVCHSFCWKPIIAGALFAIGLTFLLNLFSVAIGLTAFTTDTAGMETLVFTGLLAMSFGLIVIMFGSGWLTGYLAKPYNPNRDMGAIYGFLAWTIALILAIFIALPAQHYILYYGQFISGKVRAYSPSVSMNATTAILSEHANLVISAYILFILFFLSAFAFSLGGHIGMRHAYQGRSKI